MPADPGLDDIESNFNTTLWYEAAGDDCIDSAEGKIRMECIESHLSYDDPILYYGQPGAAHLHMFFGNTLTNHSSTYGSMRTTGGGSCHGGPLNRTGYWFPAMISPMENKVVRPTGITLYYFADERNHADVTDNPNYTHTTYALRTFPRGFWMIFGWKESDGMDPFDNGGGIWSTDKAVTGQYNSIAAVAAGEADVLSGGVYQHLTARIDSFPCWNGVLQPAGARSHLIESLVNEGDRVCPDEDYPYMLPFITVIVMWDHEGGADYGNWYISSDQGHGPPHTTYPGGHTFHTDWFGAWDSEAQEKWSNGHLKIGGSLPMQDTSNGVFCDLTRLDDSNYFGFHNRTQPPGSAYQWYLAEEFRYMDIPAVPGTVVLLGQACM
jgi:hypothetical protein